MRKVSILKHKIMNEILQKRIEEAAKKTACPQCVFNDGGTCNNDDDCKLLDDFVGLMTFALQSQWISVDEALPQKDENIKYSDTSIRVLVRLDFEGEISHRTAIYSYALHKWSQYNKYVTHWMAIPELEGGEE